MKNCFIIHGSFGTSKSNWFPWLEDTISNKGEYRVFNLDFPIGVGNQTFTNWEMILNALKKFINKDTIFFCHSSSCVFISKYLTKNQIKVNKVVFVAPFNHYFGINEDYDDVNCTFYTNNLNLLKDYTKERICYYSDNDPYIGYDAPKNFAKAIKATKIIEIKGGGHLNGESGYTKFEELLQHLD